jgi:hypothetical protein
MCLNLLYLNVCANIKRDVYHHVSTVDEDSTPHFPDKFDHYFVR